MMGEEITISYEQTLRFNSQERREFLRKEFGFDCKCELCQIKDPVVQSRITELAAAFNSCFEENRPHSQIYRLAFPVFYHCSLMEYVDFPLVALFEHLRMLAMRNDDLLRAQYFHDKVMRWCDPQLGHTHDRYREHRHIRKDLFSRGAPWLGPLVETEHTTDLIFMVRHDHEDEIYHYLRFDSFAEEDGQLTERMPYYSKRMQQMAAEKRKKPEVGPQEDEGTGSCEQTDL